MTEKLYYKTPDLLEFDAEIESVQADQSTLTVVLRNTAFYPEGGGQPADKGTINGYEVLDVQKKDDRIYHILKLEELRNAKIPKPGEVAECRINYEHRFDYMQQHSGQHIISAAMMKVAEIKTSSVHLGVEYTTVETSAEHISPDVLRQIEEEANASIRANAPIEPEWTDAEGLKKYKLRRPSKHSTDIRIINIAGIDCVACGGMHLKSTADIGLIKFTHQEKIRGHIRTFWKIGKRAFTDYAEKIEIIGALNGMHSCRQFELIEKSQANLDSLSELKYKYNKLEEDYAAVYASKLISEAEDLAGADKQVTVIKVLDNKSKGFISGLLKALSTRSRGGCSFILNRGVKTLTWAVAVTDEVDFDFNAFRNNSLTLIDGRGGGRAPLWQGAARNPEGLEAFIDKLKSEWL